MTEITQADRAAAHTWWMHREHDERDLPAYFARHREAAAVEERAKIEKLREALVEPSHPKEDHKSGWDDYRAAVYDAHLAKEDEKRQPQAALPSN